MIYEFIPTQDPTYNGYEKPWGPGMGDNLFPPPTEINITGDVEVNNNNGVLTFNKLAAGQGVIDFIIDPCPFAASGEKFACLNSFTGARIYFYENGTELAYFFINLVNRTMLESALGNVQGHNVDRYKILFNNDTIVENGVMSPMLTASAADVSKFIPYANICPIQGFNIWDPLAEEFVQVYAGYVNSNTLELYLRPYYADYDGEELVGPWMSSMDEYTEEGTPTTGAQVVDLGGELLTYQITPFMLQTLLDSLGIRQHFTDGAGLLNSLMDQAQGRVRSEEELLNRSRALKVIAIGDQLPSGLKFKPISKDVLPGLPGKFIR